MVASSHVWGKNKGPVVYPIVGTFIAVLWNLEHIHDWMTEQLKEKTSSMTARLVRPGSVVFYLIANPKNVEYILKTNFENYPKGPDETCNNLIDLLGSSIFNVDGRALERATRVAMHKFTKKSLGNLMHEIVQVELDNRLIPVLSKASGEGVLVDLQWPFHALYLRYHLQPWFWSWSRMSGSFASECEACSRFRHSYSHYFIPLLHVSFCLGDQASS